MTRVQKSSFPMQGTLYAINSLLKLDLDGHYGQRRRNDCRTSFGSKGANTVKTKLPSKIVHSSLQVCSAPLKCIKACKFWRPPCRIKWFSHRCWSSRDNCKRFVIRKCVNTTKRFSCHSFGAYRQFCIGWILRDGNSKGINDGLCWVFAKEWRLLYFKGQSLASCPSSEAWIPVSRRAYWGRSIYSDFAHKLSEPANVPTTLQRFFL